MYPNQIKECTTEEEFKRHKQLIQDLRRYCAGRVEDSNPMIYRLAEEEKTLSRYYERWLADRVFEALKKDSEESRIQIDNQPYLG